MDSSTASWPPPMICWIPTSSRSLTGRQVQPLRSFTGRVLWGILVVLLAHVLGSGAALAQDADGDGVLEDGAPGDVPCATGQIENCDDNCPYTFNPDQTDLGGVGPGSAPDGIGNACQCGDVDDDGFVDGDDGALIKGAALSLAPNELGPLTLPGFQKCDVAMPEGCSGLDGTIITRASLGLPPGVQQRCEAALLVTNNLAVEEVVLVEPAAATASQELLLVTSSTLQIGHPTEIQIRINAAEETHNVSVQFIVANKAEYDAAAEGDDNAVITQYNVGAAKFETVLAGVNDYVKRITIPDEDLDGDPILPGAEFYLYAQIDPGNEITETNEIDNVPFANQFTVIAVADDYQDQSSVVLDSLTLDFSSIALPESLVTFLLEAAGMTDPPTPKTDICENLLNPRPPVGDPNALIQNLANATVGVTAVVSTTGPPGSEARVPGGDRPPVDPAAHRSQVLEREH